MIETLVLDNGVTLLLESIDKTAVIAIGYWFTHGSRDEVKGEEGFAHFLEHMLFKGTEKRTAFQIASEIDRVGGVLNAFTEKEACCYYCTIPKEHMRLAIDVLSDMSFYSVLDPKEIENEKRVIINEIQSYMDSPEEVAYEIFMSELWSGHPLSSKITGEVDDVKNIDREKLFRFYRERYNLPKLVISIAGNFSKHDVLECLGRSFAGAPGTHFVTKRIKPERSRSWKFMKHRFNQLQVYTGIDSIPFDGLRQFYTVLAFSTIFGESMSSRLYQEIRERLGLCYSIYSFRSYYSDAAMWTIYANTTPEMGVKLIDALDFTLGNLTAKRITENELRDAKTHLAGSLVLTQEDMEVRMKRLFRLWSSHGTILEFDASMKMIDAVTLDEIEECIRSSIISRDFNLLVYGNWKGKKTGHFNFRCGE